jgi:acyl-CoA thioester hydrolase
VVDAGLLVAHLGRTSARYEIGIFAQGSDEPSAHGWFVHVFVDRATRRPAPLPASIRAALERLASVTSRTGP